MHSDFFFFFNYECQFLVVLIVMGGTLLVPYGFTVLDSCLVIAASAVTALCTALLTVKLCCSVLYF